MTTGNSGGTNGFVLGIISSLIGQHHRGNLGPYNDQICAGGPRLIHSETDDGPFLEDNMSRTSPTILITLVNAPHTPSVIPGFTAWEEVSGHVFHVCSLHERWDLLFMAVPLWSRQVSIKINGHQQHSTAVALPDGQYYVHNCWGVIWGKITPGNEPSSPDGRQLKACKFWPMQLFGLDLEVRRALVEDGNPPAVPVQHGFREEVASLWIAYLDFIRNLGLLKDPQAQFGLSHYPQCRLESSFSPLLVTDIIITKPYHSLPLPSCMPHPSLHMCSRAPTNYQPTVNVSPLAALTTPPVRRSSLILPSYTVFLQETKRLMTPVCGTVTIFPLLLWQDYYHIGDQKIPCNQASVRT